MDSSPPEHLDRSRVYPVVNLHPGKEQVHGLWRAAGGWWWPMGLPLLAFLMLPLLILITWTGPEQVWENLSRNEVQRAIVLSLKTSFLATALTIVFGTPLAFWLARRRVPLRRLWDTFVDLPMVLPPAVAGVALLVTFGRRGFIGGFLEEWNIHIAFTQTAVILAQMFVSAPLFVRTSIIGFSNVEQELEEAAMIDGAGQWDTFRNVTLPLSRKALLSGAVLTWARALGEFGATIIFAGNFPGRTQTMPLAIYIGFELDLSIALTLSVILMSASFLTLILVKYFLLA